MSKYIDADKLTKFEETLADVIVSSQGLCTYEACKNVAKREAPLLIASLQQEQLKLSGYDKALLEVKSKVDELYEEVSIGLSEYDSGLYNGIAETCMKLRGFIKARLDSDEQPEVDFETEYAKFSNDPDALDYAFPIDLADYKDFARHFYELGLNAKKG